MTTENPICEPEYVSQKAAAIMLSTSPQYIRKLEAKGFPKPVRSGSFVRYSVAEIKAWIQSNRSE